MSSLSLDFKCISLKEECLLFDGAVIQFSPPGLPGLTLSGDWKPNGVNGETWSSICFFVRNSSNSTTLLSSEAT
jgi:hypothetical protein